MKTIVFTAAAAKQFDELPTGIRSQLTDALNRYAIDGLGDVRKLAGRAGHRLRVGRYRILFDEDQQTILAVYVGKRETTIYLRN